MKSINKIAVLLLFVFIAAVAGAGQVWASCTNPEGIWLGQDKMAASKTEWSLSVINLTNSNLQVGAAGSTDNDLPGFPYGTIYPPGNTNKTNPSATTVNLTTWESKSDNRLFNDHCTNTVNYVIQDGSNSYNFSLVFMADSNNYDGKAVAVHFGKPYNASSWKYSTSNTSGTDGYYSYNPRGNNEGILFAISDKYILSLYKPNKLGNGGNQLFLVVTQKFTNSQYKGNKLQWFMD